VGGGIKIGRKRVRKLTVKKDVENYESKCKPKH